MLQEHIKEMDEYQAQAEKTAEAKAGQATEAKTLGEALAPVLDWEQSDAQFWIEVAKLLVLLAILYHVRRGPPAAYGGVR